MQVCVIHETSLQGTSRRSRAVPAKKCSKTSVLHMKSSCFADQTYCFFNVPVAVAVVVAKADVVGDNKIRSKEGNKALRRKGYH